jgi:hypothetical protein
MTVPSSAASRAGRFYDRFLAGADHLYVCKYWKSTLESEFKNYSSRFDKTRTRPGFCQRPTKRSCTYALITIYGQELGSTALFARAQRKSLTLHIRDVF